jgi:hypothetical protein
MKEVVNGCDYFVIRMNYRGNIVIRLSSQNNRKKIQISSCEFVPKEEGIKKANAIRLSHHTTSPFLKVALSSSLPAPSHPRVLSSGDLPSSIVAQVYQVGADPRDGARGTGRRDGW